MRLKFENIKENPANLLRRAGYVFRRREGEKMNFIKPLARSGYPRFHIYTESEGETLVINLHLDQKRATYGSATRHHGEYEDSDVVKIEAERIQQMIKEK
jgi:hypothetical protein